MRKSERTRKYIIEKAAPIFNKKGFAGTSLSDLTAATGLTKGSIYGNFDDKEDIAAQVFEFGLARIKQAMTANLNQVQNPSEQIFQFLDFFMEYVFEPPIEGGCVLLNTAVEADDNQPVLRKHASDGLTGVIKYVQELLEHSNINWKKQPFYTPISLAYAMFCSIEGAIMMSRVQGSIQPMQEVNQYWKRQIKLLETQ